jgi:HK97 family phage prohead protease
MPDRPQLELPMELREVDDQARQIVGVVVPYDEVTYLSPHPGGERVARGAFAKSIAQRSGKVPLFRNHDHARKLGHSIGWTDDAAGLTGTFAILPGAHGDELLEDCRNGCLDSLSAGFIPLVAPRGRDGVVTVRDAKLHEVSVTALPAYQGAGLLAVRSATQLDDLLAPFRNPPAVNLAPLAPIGYRSRR